MNKIFNQEIEKSSSMNARDWVQILARYRTPNLFRSTFELTVTLVPFLTLWVLAWMSISYSIWLTLALCDTPGQPFNSNKFSCKGR